jgi:hypothetical protein
MSLFTPHIKLGKYSSADVERWKNTNIIVLYVSIKNNKIVTEKTIYYNPNMDQWWNDRGNYVVKMIERTLLTHIVPDVEILVNVMDKPMNNPYYLQFSRTTNQNSHVLPNFTFYKWFSNLPYFMDIKKDLIKNNVLWEDKIDKIMWAGNNSANIRIRLNELATNSKYYYNLLEHGGNFVDLIDHGKYRYLLDIEGIGYSGRVPYLLLTGSCVIILENEEPDYDYKLYYENDLIENVHYLKVKYNKNDSVDTINDKILNKIANTDCKTIGEKSLEFAKDYFTNEKIDQYIAEVLRYYASLYEVSDTAYNTNIIFNRNLGSVMNRNMLLNKYRNK